MARRGIDFPIIGKLGGRREVRDRLASAGMPRTYKALKMWTYRGRIPGDVQTALWDLAVSMNIAVGPDDFRLPPRVEKRAA